MTTWQPQHQDLQQLLLLLGEATRPENIRELGLINQRLLSFNEYPDYNSYLAYILTKLSHANIDTRRMAGTCLKNNIKNNFNDIPIVILDYIKQCCIDTLEHPQPTIYKNVSAVIAAIVGRGQVHNWLQIILILLEKLDDTNPVILNFAMETLVMICEDSAHEMDQEMHGIRPLRFMLPKFIHFYSNIDPELRIQAINATSQFVLIKPVSLATQLDIILAALYSRVSDTDPRVRYELCRILTLFFEAFPQKLGPYLYLTIDYMVKAATDPDHNIQLAACDFWMQYAHTDYYRDEIIDSLPSLVHNLIQLMIYSDSDLLHIGHPSITAVEKHPQHVSLPIPKHNKTINDDEDDDDQSIRPSYYRPKNQPETNDTESVRNSHELSDVEEDDSDYTDDHKGSDGIQDENPDQDDDDFDADEFYSEDNLSLRKCSAAALDALSESIGDEIAAAIIERLVNYTLFDENWLVRESGILALGAAAKGGINVISQHLSTLIPYLLKSMQDPQPLVRSISCWAISRFASWLTQQYDINMETRKTYFEPVLYGLLKLILDPHKRVQESACTAFIELGDSAKHRLKHYIYPILIHTKGAFELYQRKNRLMLYDALTTLADAAGSDLNHSQYICLLMPPLINKWNQLADNDTDLFPLLECLSNITAALGPAFIHYVDPVLTRCLKLISSTLHEQILADQYPDKISPPNVEFLIAALDLLSGIVQGLGPKIEPLIAQTNPPLLVLLGRCIHDPVPEVLQSTFVLIGDIAIASFNILSPFLHDIMREMMLVLHNNRGYLMSISVYNNALWAIGEIVMRWRRESQPYIPGLISVFLPLLTHPQAPSSIHENAMIALGRLGLACPQSVAPFLKTFVRPWLEKALSVREGDEKDSAFRGLCAIIKFNAQDAQDELYLLLVAISTLETPSKSLLVELNDVVQGYKNKTEEGVWEYATSQLNPISRKHLTILLPNVGI